MIYDLGWREHFLPPTDQDARRPGNIDDEEAKTPKSNSVSVREAENADACLGLPRRPRCANLGICFMIRSWSCL